MSGNWFGRAPFTGGGFWAAWRTATVDLLGVTEGTCTNFVAYRRQSLKPLSLRCRISVPSVLRKLGIFFERFRTSSPSVLYILKIIVEKATWVGSCWVSHVNLSSSRGNDENCRYSWHELEVAQYHNLVRRTMFHSTVSHERRMARVRGCQGSRSRIATVYHGFFSTLVKFRLINTCNKSFKESAFR